MSDSKRFLTGVVEGFYGREWPFQARRNYAAYLAQAGLNTYLYCPKGDPYLRKRWRESWPAATLDELQALGNLFTARELEWGVGLSPYELYCDYGANARNALRQKVDELAQLNAPLLAILFDDMPGDVPNLAQRQAEIASDVAGWAPDSRLLVCPTYYSFDPVLEQHFGAMPPNYWQSLGENMPQDVDIFWTGNRVCSDAILTEDIEAITHLLGRRVLLWDNYPVNDGALRSNFLYTQPLTNRHSELREMLAGHLCNPMNQPLLSLPALTGLAQLYGATGLGEDQLTGILGREVWLQLQTDREEFQCEGLSGLGEQRCASLAQVYGAMRGAAAQEIAEWLRGEYRFDPACLTD